MNGLLDKQQQNSDPSGMLWIDVAAQFSLPMPDVRTVFSFTDIPAYVVEKGKDWIVSTRTTVRPDGRAQECTDDGRSSGDAKLDSYTCAIIVKRAKLRPAKWLDGSPSYAVVRVPISYSIGGPPPDSEVEAAYRADLDIPVNRLPAGAKRRTIIPLVIAVDENGRVVACKASRSADGLLKVFGELVPIACQQITTQFTTVPVKDASGKAMHSVQTAFVAFTIKPPS